MNGFINFSTVLLFCCVTLPVFSFPLARSYSVQRLSDTRCTFPTLKFYSAARSCRHHHQQQQLQHVICKPSTTTTTTTASSATTSTSALHLASVPASLDSAWTDRSSSSSSTSSGTSSSHAKNNKKSLSSSSSSNSATTSTTNMDSTLSTTTTTTAAAASVPSYRKLIVFASTTFIIWLSEPLLSLVDTTVVGLTQGHTAVLQLASLGPATTLMDSVLLLTYFLALATNNILSEGLAQRDWRDLQKKTSNVLTVAIALGMAVSAFCFTAGPFLLKQMAGAAATPELLRYAVQYAFIRASAAPAAVLGMVGQAFCLANLDVKSPALAVLAASVVNISGDILLRQYGVVGAALATALATVSSTAVLMHAVWHKRKEYRLLELKEWHKNKSISKTTTMAAVQVPVLNHDNNMNKNSDVESDSGDTAESDMNQPQQYALEQQQQQQKQQQEQQQNGPLETSIHLSGGGVGSGGVGSGPMNATAVESMVKTETALKVQEQEQPPKQLPFFSFPNRKNFMRLLQISGPLFFISLLMISSYSSLTIKAAAHGATALAAHNIMMRIFYFFVYFGDSMSQTAQCFLPAAIYPVRNDSLFAEIKKRLMVLSTCIAIISSQASFSILTKGASILAHDAGIVHVMRHHAEWLAVSLALHPFLSRSEGQLIAIRDFKSLFQTYCISTTLFAVALCTSATTLAGVWRALAVFQMSRLVNFQIWRRRQPQPQQQFLSTRRNINNNNNNNKMMTMMMKMITTGQ